jgi:cytochrome c-type biogenesis protein CcmH/NrfG
MTKETKVANGYAKKETVLFLICISLAVGFLAGVVYSSFKLRYDAPRQTSAPHPRTVQDQGTSPEQAENIKALERETSSNPGNVEAWIRLGNLYFDTKKHLKAIEAYQKSLELSPNNADVLTDMGVMYRRSGQPHKAVEAFDKAMEVDPRHETSRFNKGIVLMHDQNNSEGAIKAWEELLSINPFATAPNGQPIEDLINKLKQNVNR